MNEHDTEVLIVGAGPTGMVVAHQLARYGVSFRLVDKHAAPLELSKSAALHARTMEIFEDIGVVGRVLEEGREVDKLVLRTGHADRMQLDFSGLGDTRYPYMIDLPQNRTEHILIDGLDERGVGIEREVLLAGFRQYEDRVEATLQHKDGREERVSARWLVGTDGAGSTVREGLGLEFEGKPYADDWVLSDAELDWPLPRNEMTFSADSEGLFGVFPLPGENRYRLAYTQNHDANGDPVEPSVEDVQRSMKRTGIEGRVLDSGDFWVFDLDHRQVRSYRQSRVFLAGDAGHVHTPFGGQGMNLGIGDAYNLGWKLGLVASGEAGEDLLESYDAERHPVAEGVIRTTHLGASAMLLRDDPRRWIRDPVMGLINNAPPVRHRLAYQLSQLEHNYRGTALVAGETRRLAAGDRAPDEPFFDGASNSYRRISELLAGPKHKLLLVESRDEHPLTRGSWREIAESVSERYPDLIETHLITADHSRTETPPPGVKAWTDRGMDLSRYHQPGSTSAYLVRPDGYLAYVHSPARLGHLLSYLRDLPYKEDRIPGQPASAAPAATTNGATKAASLADGKATGGKSPSVVPIPLRGVNAYLLRGERTVLVDAGFSGNADTIQKELAESEVNPEEVSLILLTHGHPDHAGSAAALRERLGVPVAIHPLEAEWMRSGETLIPEPVRPLGRAIGAITRPGIQPFEPDLLLGEGQSLSDYGVNAEILHTPGHSPGSVSLLIPGGETIAGDLMAGGFVRQDQPDYPFLAEDVPRIRRSIEKLMSHEPTRLYFGHGKPASGESARRRFASDVDLSKTVVAGPKPSGQADPSSPWGDMARM